MSKHPDVIKIERAGQVARQKPSIGVGITPCVECFEHIEHEAHVSDPHAEKGLDHCVPGVEGEDLSVGGGRERPRLNDRAIWKLDRRCIKWMVDRDYDKAVTDELFGECGSGVAPRTEAGRIDHDRV